MSVDNKDFTNKVTELIEAYQTNQNLPFINPNESWKCAEIKNINGINLYLKMEQSNLKIQLLDLIFPKNLKKSKSSPDLTLGYVNSKLDDFIARMLRTNLLNLQDNINELYKRIFAPIVEKITVGHPITLNLLTNSPIVKIIDVTITSNPKLYLDTYFPNRNKTRDDSELKKFYNPDLYNSIVHASLGAFSTVDAIDMEQAKIKFNRNCRESMAFIRLFANHSDMYLGIQKNETISYLFINDKETSLSSNNLQSPNRVTINDELYKNFMDNGLEWLNDWNSHKDSIKAKKIKDSLFWYYNLYDQVDITRKLIYASTILETLLKKDDEKLEIKTSIAERCAFLISPNKNIRIDTFEFISKMYDLRSNIIHLGCVLESKFEYFVEQIIYYVKIIIILSIKKLSSKDMSFQNFIDELRHAKFK